MKVISKKFKLIIPKLVYMGISNKERLLVVISLSIVAFSMVTALDSRLPVLPITQIVDNIFSNNPKQIFNLVNNKLVLLYPGTFEASNITTNTLCVGGRCIDNLDNIGGGSINVDFHWFVPPKENRTYCTTYNGQQACEIQFSLCKALVGEGGNIPGTIGLCNPNTNRNCRHYDCDNVAYGIFLEDIGYNINGLSDADNDRLKELIIGFNRDPVVFITNPNPYVLTDYQVRVDISTITRAFGTKLIKITDITGNKVNFCYEQSNGECNRNPTNIIWIKVPRIPANGWTYLVVTKSGSNQAVNGDQVFVLYDDFNGNSL
ncbi:MAG TPA: DUF2341 domain-containing protein, partial [Candidatus Nanopusillus sp.]|nr:DUF2341 domain-containing protein [Candidatus Nanopusillus sp.]